MSKGAYVLIMEITDKNQNNNSDSRFDENYFELEIGKLGKVKINFGYYLYIGSAMGSGAVSLIGRVLRHVRSNTLTKIKPVIDNSLRNNRKLYSESVPKKHWHIDYLLCHQNVFLIKIILFPTSEYREECAIANLVKEYSDGFVEGFGSSDCDCVSHLYYFKKLSQIPFEN
ncbi:MAG: GIY-YIG nuclease family protein [Promethearchaeota archaeon]